MMLEFYRGKRVFVTGHTGFKGAWLCLILSMAGAEVTGYALPPAEGPNLYEIANVGEKVARFAQKEGLTGHARSVLCRLEEEDA